MLRPDGGLPPVENVWPEGSGADDVVVNLEKHFRYAIWNPDTRDAYGHVVAESVHPAGTTSQSVLFKDIETCARFTRESPATKLLPRLGVRAEVQNTNQGHLGRAELTFASGDQIASAIEYFNGRLPREHRLSAIIPVEEAKLTTVQIAQGLAEEEPALMVARYGAYGAHDIAAHLGVWESLGHLTRYAIRDFSRAVLSGDVPYDPTNPNGDDAVSQFVHNFDFNLNTRRISGEMLWLPTRRKGFILSLALGKVLNTSPDIAAAFAVESRKHAMFIAQALDNPGL